MRTAVRVLLFGQLLLLNLWPECPSGTTAILVPLAITVAAAVVAAALLSAMHRQPRR